MTDGAPGRARFPEDSAERMEALITQSAVRLAGREQGFPRTPVHEALHRLLMQRLVNHLNTLGMSPETQEEVLMAILESERIICFHPCGNHLEHVIISIPESIALRLRELEVDIPQMEALLHTVLQAEILSEAQAAATGTGYTSPIDANTVARMRVLTNPGLTRAAIDFLQDGGPCSHSVVLDIPNMHRARGGNDAARATYQNLIIEELQESIRQCPDIFNTLFALIQSFRDPEAPARSVSFSLPHQGQAERQLFAMHRQGDSTYWHGDGIALEDEDIAAIDEAVEVIASSTFEDSGRAVILTMDQARAAVAAAHAETEAAEARNARLEEALSAEQGRVQTGTDNLGIRTGQLSAAEAANAELEARLRERDEAIARTREGLELLQRQLTDARSAAGAEQMGANSKLFGGKASLDKTLTELIGKVGGAIQGIDGITKGLPSAE